MNMIEKMHKSKLAPTNLQIKENYMIMGDRYVRNVCVTELPRVFYLGMLSMYSSNPNVKLFMTTARLDMEISVLLRKEYNEKNREYRNTKDPTEQTKLEDELRSMNTFIEETIRNSDRTQNLLIVFSVSADDLDELNRSTKDLKERLGVDGFKTASLALMQENLMRLATPLFIDSKLEKVIEQNLGVPISSGSLAGMFPYVFETLKDKGGFLLARERSNAGAIVFNQFLHLYDKQKAILSQRVNGNMVVVGTSGSGKTTMMNLLVRNHIKHKRRVVWIDPENKNYAMTRRYGGTFVNWGAKDALINVFDLKPLSCEDDEDINMWDTELSIYNSIENIKTIFTLLYPNISEDTLTRVGKVAINTYEKKGITFSTPFKDLPAEAYPIFTDFSNEIDCMVEEMKVDLANQKEIELLSDLQIKMTPLLNEWKIYFNGTTSIKKEGFRDITSFGTKILFNKPQNLKNALTFIMFEYAWAECLDESIESVFVIDEAHTMILDGNSAEKISQFVRRSRKYANATVIGTQEPRDMADDRVLTDGKAMFNNSAYKVVLNLNLDAVSDLKKLTPLNETEQGLIQDFQQGEALLIAGSRRIPIGILASEKELYEMKS